MNDRTGEANGLADLLLITDYRLLITFLSVVQR